jgi:interferon-induced transmembrane protein/zinc ribbon protein
VNCPNCGTSNLDNARICVNCGRPMSGAPTPPPPPQPPPQQASYTPPPPQQPSYTAPPPSQPVGAPIPNYLWQSIVVTLCCCLPFGIVAIIFAAQVNQKLAAGDYAGAQHASKQAKMWCLIGAGLGLLVGIIYALAGGAAFLEAFREGMANR